MPDLDIIGENSGSLSLTAADIRSMTDWPDQLIIDYLNLVEMMNRITTAINSDFGTMALQNADAVAITGGTISGVTLDDIFIGDVTATNVTTVNLTATGTVNLHDVTITGYTHTSGLTDDATSVQVTITDSLVSINQDASIGQIWTAPYAIFDTSTVTNDGLILNSAFTGIADNTVGTIVARVRVKGSNNRTILVGRNVGTGSNTVYLLFSNTTNLLTISCRNGANNRVLGVSSVAYTDDTEWLSICISFNTASPDPQMYVNDVDVLDAAASGNTAGTIPYTGASKWTVGIDHNGTADFAGDIEFVWANFTAATDFSVEANRRLYFDAAGFTVDLGPTGNLPTGSTPMLYVVGAPPEFITNLGTGGGFTLQGSITGGIDSIGRLHFTDSGYYTDNATDGDMGAETFNSLGYYQDGVYVPTISSISEFTNKTIDIDLNTITVAGGANGQTLIYNATTGKFDNAKLTEGVGIDVLNAAGAITLSLDIVGLTTDTIAAGDFIAFADITETNIPNKTTWANAALTITAVGTLTVLQVDNININGNTISSTAGTDLLITPLAGQQLILDGTIEIDAGVVTGATSITSTQFLGALNGSVGAVTPAAGTFTIVVVDNITIDLNTISATSGALNLTPFAGSAIVLDGTISVDAGVVTGATSITSTQFLGAINGTIGAITPAAGVFTNLTVNDNTILGATSADTLTTNYGVITIASNIVATRALGVAAAGTTVVRRDSITFSGDAGGTTDVRGLISTITLSGANSVDNFELFDDQIEITHSAGTLTTANVHNGYARLGLAGSTTGAITTLRVHNFHIANEGSGLISTAVVYNVGDVDLIDGTGLITNLYGFAVQDLGHATRVTTLAAGFHAGNMTGGATNTVGFSTTMASGTGKWAIRASGTANSALAGNVRIGSTVAPTVALDVTGAVLISTTLGVSGNVTLGDAAGDTVTFNAGVVTLANNRVSTRALGAAATGVTTGDTVALTASGDAGGNSSPRAFSVTGTYSGSNAFNTPCLYREILTYTATNTATKTIIRQSSTEVNSSGNITTARGLEHYLLFGSSSSGVITNHANFVSVGTSFAGTGAVTTTTGFLAENIGNASLVTNARGFHCDNFTGSLTLTTGFSTAMSSGTGKWAFYSTGTASSAHAGSVRIGSVVAPTVALDVTGAALISTTLGVTGVLTLTPAISMLSTGGGPTVGELTLVIGTKTVNTTAATATCKIFFQRKTAGGTIGFATTYTISAGTSFTVSSDSALDTSVYVWWIVEAR